MTIVMTEVMRTMSMSVLTNSGYGAHDDDACHDRYNATVLDNGVYDGNAAHDHEGYNAKQLCWNIMLVMIVMMR